MREPHRISLEVVSDAICPWCWIGKRRLGKALEMLRGEIDATVTWRPFELNPGMPKAGIERRAYRVSKFGSWKKSQALDANVASAGAEDGIVFRHDLMARTPNSFDAHRVIRFAGDKGVQDAVVEALFSAYFHEGRDVGDSDRLADIAASAGMVRSQVDAMLTSGALAEEVAQDLDRFRRLGISGVPTVLANGGPLFSGAIAPAQMAQKIRAALAAA